MMTPRKILPHVLRRIENKRFRRRIRSYLKRSLKRGGALTGSVRAKYKLEGFDVHNQVRGRAKRGQLPKMFIAVPEILGYFQRPAETSAFFAQLKNILDKHYRTSRAYVYDISHAKTKQLGLAESFLFDRIVGQHKVKWQERNVVISFSGKISRDSKAVNNFLLSFGWLKELGIKPNFGPAFIDKDYSEKYVTYKMVGSRLRNADKSRGSIDLIDYFDKCLQHNGFQIKETAKSSLVDGVGEIIGNAEEHSGTPDGEWHISGCYNKDTHSCDFAIVNFGRTIYQNLSDNKSTAAEVIKHVEEVILSHRSAYSGLKQFITENVFDALNQEEPIWNVMALQDGISSQRTLSGTGNTRGQGIMDFLAFISGIKAPGSAEIFLHSGHSLIKIDYAYPIKKKLIGPNKEPRRRMVFNEKEDLLRPSDPEKVIYLKNEFKGTIFAGSFKIDRQHLIEQGSKGK